MYQMIKHMTFYDFIFKNHYNSYGSRSAHYLHIEGILPKGPYLVGPFW